MFGKKTMKFSYAVIAIAALLSISLYPGCENPVQSIISTKNVSGRLLGIYNYPRQGVKVTAGGLSTVTDITGYFSLGAIQSPYSISIIDSSNNRYLFIPPYESNNSNPITISYITDFGNTNFGNITVSYTDSSQNTGIRYVFTDFDYFNYYDDYGVNPRVISFPIPPGQIYKGSVIALSYIKDENNHIMFFNKYCKKDSIHVSGGQNIQLNLTSADFKSVPLNRTFDVQINPLTGQDVSLRYSTIVFGRRMTANYSNLMSFESYNSNNITFTVPGFYEIDCSPVAGYVSSNSQSYSSVYSSIFYTQTLSAPQAPVLISPSENASVDVNTEFVFNQGLTQVKNKFYKLYLTDTSSSLGQQNVQFEVFLEKERFSISELQNMGAVNLKGRTFYWSVEVYENSSLKEALIGKIYTIKKFMTRGESRIVKVIP